MSSRPQLGSLTLCQAQWSSDHTVVLRYGVWSPDTVPEHLEPRLERWVSPQLDKVHQPHAWHCHQALSEWPPGSGDT